MTSTTGDSTYMPSIEECARKGRPFIDIPFKKDEAARQILAYFMRRYDAAIELQRIQLLVFYADYRYYQLHGEQLTNLTYQPYAHGMHADKLIRALESGPFTEKPRVGTTATYTLQSNTGIKYPKQLMKFFEQINDETRKVSTDQLKTFVKNTTTYTETGYEETVEFTDETVDSMDDYAI